MCQRVDVQSWLEHSDDLRLVELWEQGASGKRNHSPRFPLLGHIYAFFTDTCHWTDQKHVSSGWKLKRGKEIESKSLLGWENNNISLCHNLFYCRTKRYSRSTWWSRCLTQFYYVPYAITWKKVCEIQDICAVCKLIHILWTPH